MIYTILSCGVQSQLKDSQLQVREATQSQSELSSRVKDLEKQIKNLEGDIAQAQEVRERGRGGSRSGKV